MQTMSESPSVVAISSLAGICEVQVKHTEPSGPQALSPKSAGGKVPSSDNQAGGQRPPHKCSLQQGPLKSSD